MSVVDLSGHEIATDIDPRQRATVAEKLRGVADAIENNGIEVEGFYLIVEMGGIPKGFDSGLTAEHAITMLEREKHHILCMLDGVKV